MEDLNGKLRKDASKSTLRSPRELKHDLEQLIYLGKERQAKEKLTRNYQTEKQTVAYSPPRERNEEPFET